eukprot:767838-Hanusia_phi.AAC.9
MPAVLHDAHDVRGTCRRDRRALVHRPVEIGHLLQHHRGVFALIRILAAVHLGKHDAEGVNVGLRRVGPSSEQLGGHPQGSAAGSQLLLLAEAEVGDLGSELGVDEDVLGLEVAMDDQRVRGVEEAHALSDVAEDGEDHLAVYHHGLVVQQVIQGAVIHALHDEHGLSVPISDDSAHDGGDAGMTELGEDAHLLHEVGLELGVLVFLEGAERQKSRFH